MHIGTWVYVRVLCRSRRVYRHPSWDHQCRCKAQRGHAGGWHWCIKCDGTWPTADRRNRKLT